MRRAAGVAVSVVESGRGWVLHLGDCLEAMKGLERVDHVITDPPYEAEAHAKSRRSLDVPLEIDFSPIDTATRAACGREWGRLAARWVMAFCQADGISPWREALIAGGLDWVRAPIWVKPNGAPQFTGDRPGMGYEPFALAHARGRKRWNGGGKHGVWTVPLDHRGGKNEHPTTKPLALMLALVADFTDEGETVLDPFAGSGTTGVACLRLGRRFIGIERDPRYFELAVERLRAEESGSTLAARRAGQAALFGGRE